MSLERRTAFFYDLGLTDYGEAYKIQKGLVEKVASGEMQDTILFAEHHPIVNFGMNPSYNTFSRLVHSSLQKLPLSEEEAIAYLKSRGVDFLRTQRGGGATFIGPGQINVYPIVKYERIVGQSFGVREYKELIDTVMQKVLESYGLKVKNVKVAEELGEQSDPRDRKDIWLDISGKPFKLGGKGIAFSKGVSYHGFNFYVKKGSTEGFRYVDACGYSSEELGTISIEEALDLEINSTEFKKRVLAEIEKVFKYKSIKQLSKINL